MALLDHRLKLKDFFPWLECLLTLRDVVCKLIFFKLIYVNTNWPNDLRVGYKYPSNLVKFFERDIDLKEKLEFF